MLLFSYVIQIRKFARTTAVIEKNIMPVFYLPGKAFPPSVDDDTEWTSSSMNHKIENVFLLLKEV